VCAQIVAGPERQDAKSSLATSLSDPVTTSFKVPSPTADTIQLEVRSFTGEFLSITRLVG